MMLEQRPDAPAYDVKGQGVEVAHVDEERVAVCGPANVRIAERPQEGSRAGVHEQQRQAHAEGIPYRGCDGQHSCEIAVYLSRRRSESGQGALYRLIAP